MYPKQLAIFEDIDESLPDDMTNLWKTVPTGPTLSAKGKWTSPFQSSELGGESMGISLSPLSHLGSIGVTFQEVIQSERQEENDNSQEPSRKTGVTKWLSSAMELENTM